MRAGGALRRTRQCLSRSRRKMEAAPLCPRPVVPPDGCDRPCRLRMIAPQAVAAETPLPQQPATPALPTDSKMNWTNLKLASLKCFPCQRLNTQ